MRRLPARAERIGRLLDSAVFERALASPRLAASAHFALHVVAPAATKASSVLDAEPIGTELSTGLSPSFSPTVDDSRRGGLHCVVGAVVPKRYAKRAVTRSLMKRQIYGVAQRRLAASAGGAWVVRLRGPFSRDDYASAASSALRKAVRGELESLFAAVQGRPESLRLAERASGSR